MLTQNLLLTSKSTFLTQSLPLFHLHPYLRVPSFSFISHFTYVLILTHTSSRSGVHLTPSFFLQISSCSRLILGRSTSLLFYFKYHAASLPILLSFLSYSSSTLSLIFSPLSLTYPPINPTPSPISSSLLRLPISLSTTLLTKHRLKMAESSSREPPHAPSEFPNFHNGDVMVVIPPTEIYQLHSDVLRRCSPHHLGQLVAPANAASLIKAALYSGHFTRYKLVLRPSEGHQTGVFRREVCLLFVCVCTAYHVHLENSRETDYQTGSRQIRPYDGRHRLSFNARECLQHQIACICIRGMEKLVSRILQPGSRH